MDDKDLLLLKTLYEEKNITHTARRLFMSQPALSDRLRRLEKEFDCTILIRRPRGIEFTTEGEYLYHFFSKTFQQYINTKDALASKSNVAKGLLRIGVNVNIRMYNFDDVQCTVIPSVAYGFVTGMNLQLC